jgi:hypothetical protein
MKVYGVVKVLAGNEVVSPGVYLALTVMDSDAGAIYTLSTGEYSHVDVPDKYVVEMSREGFSSFSAEIKLLKNEIKDLHSKVKVPGEVYDALTRFMGEYEYYGVALAKIIESLHPVDQHRIDTYTTDFRLIREWCSDNTSSFYRGMNNGFEREKTERESIIDELKWLMVDTNTVSIDEMAVQIYDKFIKGKRGEGRESIPKEDTKDA